MKLLVGSHPHQVIECVGENAYKAHFGMLCSPRDGKSPEQAINQGVMWAGDNFTFTNWNPMKFLDMLHRYRHFASTCTFIACPDIVQNALQTALKFEIWEPLIHDLGYPVALVAQDGIEMLEIPWHRFETLFIGGSTTWKLSDDSERLVRDAKAHGKWVHFGRVNSKRRLRWCQVAGCDSVDGSSYAAFSSKTALHLPVLQQEHFKWY